MPAQSVQSILRAGTRYYYGEQQFRDFSGGWNIRDAAAQLAANETPDCYNITLDERGGVSSRLGYQKYNGSAFTTALTSNGYYWPTGQNQITQAGAKLYKDTSTTEFKTFTTSARAAFCDFKGKLIFVHPIDGLFSYDGATVTALAAGPKGTTIAPWQNKLWVSGDPAASSRVYFCAAGDETSWPGTNFVDLREKDTEPCVCLTGASGVDVSGRPGLLAFKRRSAYRIFDSSTGAFQTLDPGVGAGSSMAVTNGFQRSVAISESGIYWTDGVGPMRPASDKIAPLFTTVNMNFGQVDLMCAGTKGDRMYFSLPLAGATANNIELEYHPIQGWIVPNSSAASFYATYGKNDQKLLAGSPTVNGQVYERLKTGADDGVAISSRYKTRWFEPTSGHPARISRVRVYGRGTMNATAFLDYQLAGAESFTVNLTGTAAVYDDPGAIYDNANTLYGPLKYQDVTDIALNDVVTAILIEFSATTTTSSSGLQLLGTGSAPEIGEWGLYGIGYSYRPLGVG